VANNKSINITAASDNVHVAMQDEVREMCIQAMCTGRGRLSKWPNRRTTMALGRRFRFSGISGSFQGSVQECVCNESVGGAGVFGCAEPR
jgi:hypothetical protein